MLWVISYLSTLNSTIIPPKLLSGVAVVYDADYDMVLFSKKADQKIHPASTTKLATFLYSLSLNREKKEYLMVLPEVLKSMPKAQKISSNYSVVPYLLEPDAYTVGLHPNSFYTIEDLYHALFLVSANDAANVLAYHLGGYSIEQFMIGLNRYLENIGCKDTTFVNPSGLEYPSHRTTAIDLVKMMAHGIKIPEFMQVASNTFYRMESHDVPDRDLRNSNRLIREDSGLQYRHCIAGKTGYTEHAGYCFVAAAKNGERTIIVSVMQSPSAQERFIDAINLFNAAFNEKKITRVFYNAFDPCFFAKPQYSSKPLKLELKEELKIETFSSICSSLEPSIKIDAIRLPVKKGDPCGKVDIISSSGQVLESRILFASESMPHTLQSFINAYQSQVLLLILVALTIFLILKKKPQLDQKS